ncbi:Na+/H+ antiporter NhaC family protein [Halobacillus sp. ACCC02827]|uniref:Na+/H+ antiporter NhaC family protein n=1 Tax=Bacillaceae TaxID=186817 RepID=UPI000429128C|nr:MULTISPECIES: Na+/H+ antiporter NhaC family protein [Bacillaceae]QHT47531.1 Na+/H+ antiporter NhaC family protein [Bacillus sp. SB49]WJE14761.1 Na+/H+ antiporter NhaC family protein [Halobacillus sp. ACCC02827]
MEGTIYSLIPAILMLILVLVTRKVILSLGIGIIVGAFMLTQMDIGAGIGLIWSIFSTIFYSEGALNSGNIYLLSFLLLLGVTTAFMTASGGSKAFGKWAVKRIRTRQGATLVPALLGIVIFIDDYFNALAVGQVAKPVTDRYRVSRAKLAYYIDSTSAPITVISPISSWGAYIIGTIGSILAANEITEYGAFEAFVLMIPANLYVFAALLLVFLTIYMRLDFGPMRSHEIRAQKTGELTNPEKGDIPGDLNDEFEEHNNGKISHLILPIVALVVGTVAMMFYTGIQATEGSATLLDAFANTNVNISLFTGGLVSVLVAGGLYISQPKPKSGLGHVFTEGLKAMLPAIYILVFAWMIGDVISQLQTGEFLANQFTEASIDIAYLPLIIFLLSGFMALSTGTSWGTFGIMLPIAGEIAAVTDPSMILPALSAVLAGSVFGDHCSPISDTTILSSTGAGSNHIDHVMTQLPYALLAALGATVGYLVLGFTGQVWIPLVLAMAIVAVIAMVIHKVNPKIEPE